MVEVKMVADNIFYFQSKVLVIFLRMRFLIVLNEQRNWWIPESWSEIGVS